MPEPFPRFQSGDSIRKALDARLLNAIGEGIASVRPHRTDRPAGELLESPAIIVPAINASGSDIDVHEILRVDTVGLTTLTAQERINFQYNPLLSCHTPNATGNVPAIAVEPIKNGKLGRVKIGGLAIVTLEVTNTDHTYARVKISSRAKMLSGTTGPARILWKDSGTGDKSALVILGVEPGPGYVPFASSISTPFGYVQPGETVTGQATVDLQVWSNPNPGEFQQMSCNVFAHWEDDPNTVLTFGSGGMVYVGSPVNRISGAIPIYFAFANVGLVQRRAMFSFLVSPSSITHPPTIPDPVSVIFAGIAGFYKRD